MIEEPEANGELETIELINENTGEEEIYLVHDQRDDGTIRVERAADVKGAELFSPLYGYVEARARSIAELDAWLAKVDDLTFAQLRDGHLVVAPHLPDLRHTVP